MYYKHFYCIFDIYLSEDFILVEYFQKFIFTFVLFAFFGYILITFIVSSFNVSIWWENENSDIETSLFFLDIL